MINAKGEIFISGRAICDALDISWQQLSYYARKSYAHGLMYRRRFAYTNTMVGRYRRKKLTTHYTVPFFLSVAFRSKSPKAETYIWLLYRKFLIEKNYKDDILIDEAELLFAL